MSYLRSAMGDKASRKLHTTREELTAWLKGKGYTLRDAKGGMVISKNGKINARPADLREAYVFYCLLP